jgi:8-oxo-dGTP pyrophosphatase MutT (NUDIX family)
VERRHRATARIVLTDDRGRVLLLRGGDPLRPDDGSWWFTPGGGIEPGESAHDAARRELFEETGLSVDDLGAPIFDRQIEHEFNGVRYEQDERYYRVRASAFEIDTTRWTDVERASIVEHRWWRRRELAATSAAFYPEDLLDRLDSESPADLWTS